MDIGLKFLPMLEVYRTSEGSAQFRMKFPHFVRMGIPENGLPTIVQKLAVVFFFCV
jgi:hypothetical protein